MGDLLPDPGFGKSSNPFQSALFFASFLLLQFFLLLVFHALSLALRRNNIFLYIFLQPLAALNEP